MPSTVQSITVNQSIDRVWNTINNFHDMSWCPNVITSCVPGGDASGDEVGAKRVLNDAFHETLIEANADEVGLVATGVVGTAIAAHAAVSAVKAAQKKGGDNE